MPTNPLARLFDRRPREEALRDDVKQALTQLARLAEQQPDLAGLAGTHAALLQAAYTRVPVVAAPAFDSAHAVSKLEAGVPLLRGETELLGMALDGRILRERYLRLCDALAPQVAAGNDRLRPAALALRAAVQSGALDPHELALEVLAGDPHRIHERAIGLDLDAELTATLLRWTLLPLLEQLTGQLQPLADAMEWEQGYCPICGAWPLLAEHRGMEQIRVMRCGLCAGEWKLERMRCPFCASRQHFDISYLYEESQPGTRRAVTCERCHGYFKAIATLGRLAPPQLIVTDLETLYLDLIALDRAYAPPS